MSRSVLTRAPASTARRTSNSAVLPPGTATGRPSRRTSTAPSTEISNTARVYGGVSAVSAPFWTVAPCTCFTASWSATMRRSRRSSRRRAPATTRRSWSPPRSSHRDGDGLLARAESVAATTRDRQLVAIAGAHRRGERELVDALARDHLVDHPDNVLVAWIAGASHLKEGS